MTPIIEVGTTTVTQLLAYAGQLFTDLTPLVVLAIGLPVGFWVINKAIGLVSARTKSK